MACVADDEVDRLLAHYPRICFACHQRHRRDPATGDELSASQGSVLDHLDEQEPTLVGALAEHLGVTSSTVSLALDRLERRGYVERRRDERDRRKVGVVLTESGVRAKEAASVLEPALVRDLLGRLGAMDRERALTGLAVLASAADRMMGEWREQRARKGA